MGKMTVLIVTVVPMLLLAQGCCIFPTAAATLSSRARRLSDCCGACKYFSRIKTAATNNCLGSRLTKREKEGKRERASERGRERASESVSVLCNF